MDWDTVMRFDCEGEYDAYVIAYLDNATEDRGASEDKDIWRGLLFGWFKNRGSRDRYHRFLGMFIDIDDRDLAERELFKYIEQY